MHIEAIPSSDQSALKQIQEYLKETKEAHEFDIAHMEFSNAQLTSILHLIQLSERASKAFKTKIWNDKDRDEAKQVNSEIKDLLEIFDLSSDATDTGMLAAFLRNKLTVIDLIEAHLSN